MDRPRRLRRPNGLLAFNARKQGEMDKEKEDKIMEAVAGIESKKYKNARHAAEELGIRSQQSTIWRRLKNMAGPRIKAHVERQLLNPQQEDVLEKWVQFLVLSGHPLCNRRAITPMIQELCGRTPSPRYIYRWLRRHPDVASGRLIGVATKKAGAFDYKTVHDQFIRLQNGVSLQGIPCSESSTTSEDSDTPHSF